MGENLSTMWWLASPLWPKFKMVHGQPRHPPSQGCVMGHNQDIANMILNLMQDHNTLK